LDGNHSGESHEPHGHDAGGNHGGSRALKGTRNVALSHFLAKPGDQNNCQRPPDSRAKTEAQRLREIVLAKQAAISNPAKGGTYGP
jgi:hypothetical protein